MRESVGNSLLLYLVVIFSGIVMLFFVGIISYSKAYRVKNKIIDVIEKYDGYTADAKLEINDSLKEAGYAVISKDFCSGNRVQSHIKSEMGILGNGTIKNLNDNVNGYNYCIFEITGKTLTSYTDVSSYYVVVTFVNFNFPLIGDLVNVPVYGETKILGKNYNY